MACSPKWWLEVRTRRLWCVLGSAATSADIALQIGISESVLKSGLRHINPLNYWTIREAALDLLLETGRDPREVGFLVGGDLLDLLERDAAVGARLQPSEEIPISIPTHQGE